MRALMIFIIMCCLHLTMDGQSITDVRYWFDQNDTEAITESISGSPWQDALDVSALSEGWHFIHYSFKDNLGQWSAVESDRFRKRYANPNDLASVTYWFNMDDSSPINVPISGTGWNSSIEVSSLPLGWHFIHFYFHDTHGQKSGVARARFRKVDSSQSQITTAEFWFDDDDSSPTVVSTSGQEITFDNDYSTSSVAPGWHDVHLRFIDNKGRPSAVISSRTRVNDGAENKVLLARFWFDDCDADDQLVYEYQDPDQSIIFFTCTCLNPCDPVVGDHQMNVQFQDTRGVWSAVASETIFFNDTPCDTDCRADINGDGIVDIQDFIELNSAFGTSCADCPADINDDGNVNIDDFITFNSSYGKICDYAFEGTELIEDPTKDFIEAIVARPDISLHKDLHKVIFSEAPALINAYPNPTSGSEIFVRLSEMKDVSLANVEVIDVTGRVIYRETYTIRGPEVLLKIDFPQQLAKGNYTLRLLMNDGYLTQGIILE